MGLIVPRVSSTSGPTYAAEINTSLTTVDSHNHTTGQGVPIPSSGININSDLSFNSFNATLVNTVRFSSVATPISATNPNLGCIYEAGVDLYYNDGNGNQIRLTQSGALAGTPGSIASLVSPASATYVSANSKFVWQSAANVAAIMDFRSAIFRTASAGSNGITLAAPPTIPSSYNLALPTIGSSTSFMSLDTSGNMAPSVAVSGGIATANIANGAVTRGKQASVGQQIASAPGQFSTTSTSPVAIGSLSVAISTTGRPVMVFLTASDGVGTLSAEQTGAGGQTEIGGAVQIQRDGVDISATIFRTLNSVATVNQVTVPPASVLYLDPVGSGTYTYSIKVNATTGGITVNVTNVNLVAYEL